MFVLHAPVDKLQQEDKLYVLLVQLDAVIAQLQTELKSVLIAQLIMALKMVFATYVLLDRHLSEGIQHAQFVEQDVQIVQ